MLPVVIRITFISKGVGSFATVMLPTPQNVKIRFFSHLFCINKPSLTHISSIGKDILTDLWVLYMPLLKNAPRQCLQSTFYKS